VSSAYVTELSMPLVGMSGDAVLAEVRRALADGERIERVAENQSGDHLDVAVQFLAASAEVAERLAAELHDRVLRAVLAAAPEDRGWTSSFGPPELARPGDPAT
jgi:hypothetical protein